MSKEISEKLIMLGRLLGFAILVIGLIMIYYTVTSKIDPLNYGLLTLFGVLVTLSGFILTVAKYERRVS